MCILTQLLTGENPKELLLTGTLLGRYVCIILSKPRVVIVALNWFRRNLFKDTITSVLRKDDIDVVLDTDRQHFVSVVLGGQYPQCTTV